MDERPTDDRDSPDHKRPSKWTRLDESRGESTKSCSLERAGQRSAEDPNEWNPVGPLFPSGGAEEDPWGNLISWLESVESDLRRERRGEEWDGPSTLRLLCRIAGRRRIRKSPELFERAFGIVSELCRSSGTSRRQLERLGYCSKIIQIMGAEVELGEALQASVIDGHGQVRVVTPAHLLACFLPAVPDTRCSADLDILGRELLLASGRIYAADVADSRREVFNTLERVLPGVLRLETPLYAHRLLLLKAVHWAESTGVLTKLVNLDELADRAIDILLLRNPEDLKVGLALVRVLMRAGCRWYLHHARVCGAIREASRSTVASPSVLRLIDEVCAGAGGSWGVQRRAELRQCVLGALDDEPTRAIRSRIVDSVLNFVMPPEKYHMSPEAALRLSYLQLTTFLEGVICLERGGLDGGLSERGGGGGGGGIVEGWKPQGEQALVPSHVRTLFGRLVLCAVEEMESHEYDGCFASLRDMLHEKRFGECDSDVYPGLFTSPSLDRVLGPSLFTEGRRSSPLVRRLRLLSVLYELNENWSVLYCVPTEELLCDRKLFVSKKLDGKIQKTRCYSQFLIDETAVCYPFLLSARNRLRAASAGKFRQLHRDVNSVEITVVRSRVLQSAVVGLGLVHSPTRIWLFKFRGEIGKGSGPTKEFYSEVSRDCQRHEFGLWAGEPREGPGGVMYTHSPGGLYPAPNPSMSMHQERMYVAMGKIIAKTLLDHRQLDLHFSRSLYRRFLLRKSPSLIDLKDVAPGVFRFAESLARVVRRKRSLEDETRFKTSEEREELMSGITCDGVAFEDLCIDFTVPGFPELEMKEGGRNQELTVHNVEEYLKLLVWHLVYKLPSRGFQKLCEGFWEYLPIQLDPLHPEEIERLLCGSGHEPWTVDYLRDNCQLENGLTAQSPVVRFLFEVLSSFAVEEQRQFLKFVTSVPRLPVGGLASLYPQFTVIRRSCDSDPDAYLPSSMTCFNSLFVTDYTSKRALREKLLLAVREGDSFQFV